MTRHARIIVAVVVSLAVLVPTTWGAPRVTIAVVKVTRGPAWIQRAGAQYPMRVGMQVWESDLLLTGATGAMGATFLDESLISLGPNSALAIVRYDYNPVTYVGRFETVLYRGTLTAASGRIVRKSPEAMTVTTPRSVIKLGGTDVAVRVGGD